MNPPPTTPSTPDIRQEQILELLADHVASNERVVATVVRVGEKFPQEAERVLREHRQHLAQTPAPRINLPANPDIPAMRREIASLVQMWGIVLAIVIILSSGVILFFVLRC